MGVSDPDLVEWAKHTAFRLVVEVVDDVDIVPAPHPVPLPDVSLDQMRLVTSMAAHETGELAQ